MKRSSSVRLTLMGAATAASLSACDSPSQGPVAFNDVGQCIASGIDRSRCQSAYDEAIKAHAEKAPRFASRDECLKSIDVNDCVSTPVRNPDGSATSMFVPALGGFLLGQALAQRQQPQQQQQGGGGGGGFGGALYRSRDYPTQYRDSGDLATSRQRSPTGTTVSRPPNVNTTTIARSGFGSSSSSFGGHSSS
jgi:uncharacterized protein YgiB involved in biofilm formation